ncbi:carbohydrate deacetylase [Chloroflexota bacterium]
MAHLMITVDDCGLSEGINHATAELHEKGIVNTASIITSFPAAQHAFALFARYPELEMGVHLNLTEGYALVKPDTPTALVDQAGRFRSRFHLFSNALLGNQRFLAQVEAELRTQIEVFLHNGIQPGHLSTHMHFHIVPSLRRIVVKLAQEYNIPWIRSFDPMTTVVPFSSKVCSQNPTGKLNDTVQMHDHLAGLYFWRILNPGLLSAELIQLPGTVEVVVHAGLTNDPTFPANVPYTPKKRAAEKKYLERLYPLLAKAQAN